ncbi:methyltransferase domain-containing protein [Talaromyces proteolyticus]|uniref:Methyltransferase domain-containing protein n=1 Tax=Talaromyces proteolyticus TaxID=1131652 RepID=A0AAD4KZL6_9EURO|nr:methyltransferase domain-containing protein [Talaromyces proteolyticus]KAH8704823.1 methyltransferase domain-containing protein [Talaromyces proteolyticus]
MLPTPSTSHVSFDTVYEPAEDSYLFLDTLSSASEAAWLTDRFNPPSNPSPNPVPLVVEVGSGSGVVIAFTAANARHIFGRDDILALSIDVNSNACHATSQTVQTAISEKKSEAGGPVNTLFAGSVMADLVSPLRPGSVDVLLFNPPYVPTPDIPVLPSHESTTKDTKSLSSSEKFEYESYLLSLSYAGGEDGMEITNRFIDAIPSVLNPDRGVAYLLLCAQNKPEQVKARIMRDWQGWTAETVGKSGMQAGWEKLVIVRICRDET